MNWTTRQGESSVRSAGARNRNMTRQRRCFSAGFQFETAPGTVEGLQSWMDNPVRAISIPTRSVAGSASGQSVPSASSNLSDNWIAFDATNSLRAHPLYQTVPILDAFRLRGNLRERAARPPHGL